MVVSGLARNPAVAEGASGTCARELCGGFLPDGPSLEYETNITDGPRMADSYDCSTRGSTLKSGWHRFYTHTAWREQCPSVQEKYHGTRNPAPPEKGATVDTLEALILDYT